MPVEVMSVSIPEKKNRHGVEEPEDVSKRKREEEEGGGGEVDVENQRSRELITSSPMKKARKTKESLPVLRKLHLEEEDAEASITDRGIKRSTSSSNIKNTIFSPQFTLHKRETQNSGTEDTDSEEEEEVDVETEDTPKKSDFLSDETLGDVESSPPTKSGAVGAYLSQYSLRPEEEQEEDEEEEYEDFDPFLFISQLSPLTEEILSRPKALGPSKKPGKKTLVLDLDETLVHCSTEMLPGAELQFPVDFNGVEFQVFVRKRPHFKEFLERVSRMFEVIIFTASQEVYASKLLSFLDPDCKYIDAKLYRDSCVNIEGNYLKDLNVLGRDLSKTLIIDNSPQAFGYQLDNGIPIESWFDDMQDNELMGLIPFLEELVEVDDVRPFIRKKFELYKRVEQRQKVLNLVTFLEE